MKEYERVLKALNERLEEKHKQYGTSYKNKLYFMFLRLREEMRELETEILQGTYEIKKEALDVAICGLLIADIIMEFNKE